MTIENINIDITLKRVEALLLEDKDLSSSTKSLLEVLILIVTLLANRLNLNSKNSSKPPSVDQNRKITRRKKSSKQPGSQKGHVGTTLRKVENPDYIEIIQVDRTKLPPGKYKELDYESRQVVDIDISRIVTEYKAQVLVDSNGNRFTAPFPKGVTKAVQYGEGLKAHAVYSSQVQLIKRLWLEVIAKNKAAKYFSNLFECFLLERGNFTCDYLLR